MRKKDPETARRRKIRRAVVIEIVVMSVGVLCCILPLPWRLCVLIAIGAREIVLKGIRAAKESPAPAVVHCCGGDKAKQQNRRKVPEQAAKQDELSTQVEKPTGS